jgi:hypothetical protein
MFALDKFRMIDRKRAAAAAKLSHANDNCRVERHAPTTAGRTALVGHWRQNAQTGRLEWHWSLEAVSDEPETPPSPPRTLRAGHTHSALNATSTVDGLNCHPTVTQLDVVRASAKATLIFARN